MASSLSVDSLKALASSRRTLETQSADLNLHRSKLSQSGLERSRYRALFPPIQKKPVDSAAEAVARVLGSWDDFLTNDNYYHQNVLPRERAEFWAKVHEQSAPLENSPEKSRDTALPERSERRPAQRQRHRRHQRDQRDKRDRRQRDRRRRSQGSSKKRGARTSST